MRRFFTFLDAGSLDTLFFEGFIASLPLSTQYSAFFAFGKVYSIAFAFLSMRRYFSFSSTFAFCFRCAHFRFQAFLFEAAFICFQLSSMRARFAAFGCATFRFAFELFAFTSVASIGFHALIPLFFLFGRAIASLSRRA